MQCPKCKRKNFKIDIPCPQCGFQGDATKLDEVWSMNDLENFNMDAPPVFKLKALEVPDPNGIKAASDLRLPAFTAEEAEKAWAELTTLETLFEKVEEWQTAGYFKPEMGSLDPVKMQRARADELRQRLEDHPRPATNHTAQDRLKTVSYLMDTIDLLDSREWFNKKDLEKVVAPIMAMIADAISDDGIE